jgi:polyisoprenoid-binding protein YceI
MTGQFVIRNQMKWAVGLVLGLMITHIPAGWAKPLHFKVTGGPGNTVEFTSDAPVEVIHGTTNRVNGDIVLDDSFQFDAKHPFNVNFAVDLASIDTGIELRNEHMRDNFLETGKYPQATYKATSIKVDKKPNLKKPQTVHLMSTGDFTVHGVTVKKTIPLTVDYTPTMGSTPAHIRLQGKFPVPLEQHHIKRPEAVLVKLADTISVSLDMQGNAVR